MTSTMHTVRGGPPLLVPAAAFALLTAGAAVIGAAGPRPDTAPADVLADAVARPGAIALSAALLLGSGIPLVVYAATALRRIEGAGLAVPGPVMAFAGAVLAAASLSVSALAGWAGAAVAPLGDPVLARLLATLWFGAGGPGSVAPLGLVLLGLSVPVLLGGLAPRWVGWAGVVVGGCALASVSALATPVLYPLLPVGRFGGLLVLLALAGTLRPARRGVPS
ncbi:DUF4386 domain-containing protein [Pseudonocardia sp. DR1-2]|uniref:DUF4386 domain-containing protein n=1 Tax=Pseudonocardia sp. DR1-2 TaxID=2951168 RepID=UPI0020431885|nr:DUF4386 domain-containing protein [Pseudonocardia sp. DR1-2]MCM3844971.1 DUF4386 domain-containing protein [Pseudonocardia sp. DR1-2]